MSCCLLWPGASRGELPIPAEPCPFHGQCVSLRAHRRVAAATALGWCFRSTRAACATCAIQTSRSAHSQPQPRTTLTLARFATLGLTACVSAWQFCSSTEAMRDLQRQDGDLFTVRTSLGGNTLGVASPSAAPRLSPPPQRHHPQRHHARRHHPRQHQPRRHHPRRGTTLGGTTLSGTTLSGTTLGDTTIGAAPPLAAPPSATSLSSTTLGAAPPWALHVTLGGTTPGDTTLNGTTLNGIVTSWVTSWVTSSGYELVASSSYEHVTSTLRSGYELVTSWITSWVRARYEHVTSWVTSCIPSRMRMSRVACSRYKPACSRYMLASSGTSRSHYRGPSHVTSNSCVTRLVYKPCNG